ncbi:MAG: hypothetical protein MKZ53_01945 [Candidatus Thalassarchaeum sp.]|nr:hypothetical protein [Candidatus Thalassarchaeum sp.]
MSERSNMLETSVEGFSFENQSGNPPDNSQSPFEILFGIICLVLLIPAIFVAFGEFRYIIDYFEYGGDMSDVLSWILYSTTIISILLISGLHFTGLIKSTSWKLVCGGFIIAISIMNLFSRFSDFGKERREWGIDEFWLDFLYWPSTHERLELAFLGIIIGFFVIKK